MAQKILDEFESNVDSLTLVPSDGGRFEVTVDDKLVYSKLATGRHADYEDIASPIRNLR